MPTVDKRSAEVMAERIQTELQKDPDFAATLAQPEVIRSIADQAIDKADGSVSSQTKKAEAERELTAATADSRVYLIAVSALSLVSVVVVVTIGVLAWRQIGPLIADIAATGSAANAPAGGAAAEAGKAQDGASPVQAVQRLVIAIPDGLVALGSAAIGALAGLLGPLSSRK